MNDQAKLLREMMNRQEMVQSEKREMEIITVTSGKGGVGKSNFSINLALALKAQGKKPLILDGDFGLANIEILLGEHPKYNLTHLIHQQCTISEIVTNSQYGVTFISGGSAVKEMNFLTASELNQIASQLDQLHNLADVLIIDTGAGIHEIGVKFCDLADQVYMVVTPEPTSITDAYALLKTLIASFKLKTSIKIVMNKVESQGEAQQVYGKLRHVCKNFLDFDLGYAGYIPYDDQFMRAIKEQVPILKYAPEAKASRAYWQLAQGHLGQVNPQKKTFSIGENWLVRFRKLFG